MIVALVPLLFAVVGALTFALTTDKIAEMGRLAFVVGLLWLVYTMATKTVTIG